MIERAFSEIVSDTVFLRLGNTRSRHLVRFFNRRSKESRYSNETLTLWGDRSPASNLVLESSQSATILYIYSRSVFFYGILFPQPPQPLFGSPWPMFFQVPAGQIQNVLDEVAEAVLSEARITGPPVNAIQIAGSLGLVVAGDNKITGRARFVRLGQGGGAGQGAILVGPEERPERLQWAVAHEIGEVMAHRVFSALGVSPTEAKPAAREEVANELAGRILLPKKWFLHEAGQCGWDLLELKTRFSTASHELIARRTLDGSAPIIVTVFDQDRISWRRTNLGARAPNLSEIEITIRRDSNRESRTEQYEDGVRRIRCWAIHEPEWQREIMRTELLDIF